MFLDALRALALNLCVDVLDSESVCAIIPTGVNGVDRGERKERRECGCAFGHSCGALCIRSFVCVGMCFAFP